LTGFGCILVALDDLISRDVITPHIIFCVPSPHIAFSNQKINGSFVAFEHKNLNQRMKKL
jgi:hypothetical protein